MTKTEQIEFDKMKAASERDRAAGLKAYQMLTAYVGMLKNAVKECSGQLTISMAENKDELVFSQDTKNNAITLTLKKYE